MKQPLSILRPGLMALLFASVLATSLVAQDMKPQRGNASFYSDRFHGRRMSNGDRYHRDSMTCAHLRYPLGTWLRVRNLDNGREVVVQVTDRGPYTRKFVIDLSRAAARQLGIIQYGYRMVEIIPFTPGQVPYKYEPSTERPELGLGYSADSTYTAPYWQEDSIYLSRHRLSRTAVVKLHPDSLKQAVTKDTTLFHQVRKSHGDTLRHKNASSSSAKAAPASSATQFAHPSTKESSSGKAAQKAPADKHTRSSKSVVSQGKATQPAQTEPSAAKKQPVKPSSVVANGDSPSRQ